MSNFGYILWIFGFIFTLAAPSGMKLFFGIIFVIGTIMVMVDYNNNKKKKEEEERQKAELERQEAERKKRRDFYVKCRSQNIQSLSTPVQREKARLIANSLGLTGIGDFDKFFEEIMETFGEEDRKAAEKRLKEAREKERQEEQEATKYANFYGRDKRVAMLVDQWAPWATKVENYNNFDLQALHRSTQQKEHDWALLGGMASGLAGGAAGIATAVDAQMKNAEIRQQNAANTQAVAAFAVAMRDQNQKNLQKVREYERLIEDAKTKLVSEVPADQVMEMIEMSDVDVSILYTGSFRVYARASIKKQPDDFEGRKAVIDGTISAILYQDGNEVGSAKLVLGIDGLKNGEKLRTICCGNADPSKEYEVKFKPYKLWIMEA